MKKVSRKSIAIVAVVIVTCVVMGLAAFILLRDDKPVYTPAVATHELSPSDVMSSENYRFLEFTVGPDVTGKSYNIKVHKTEAEEYRSVTFISIDDGKKQKVADDDGNSGYLYDVISMIDDNGKPVIVVNMDYMSDDYFFVMYTVKDGNLVRCGTDEAMITQANTDRTFTAVYRINFLGSWNSERTVKLTDSNSVRLQDGEYKLPVDDSRKITALVNVKAEIADADGNYKSYTIKKGSVISLYATDGKSYVLFTDAEGNKGRIKCEGKNGFTFIGEKYDYDLFDGLVYAG